MPPSLESAMLKFESSGVVGLAVQASAMVAPPVPLAEPPVPVGLEPPVLEVPPLPVVPPVPPGRVCPEPPPQPIRAKLAKSPIPAKAGRKISFDICLVLSVFVKKRRSYHAFSAAKSVRGRVMVRRLRLSLSALSDVLEESGQVEAEAREAFGRERVAQQLLPGQAGAGPALHEGVGVDDPVFLHAGRRIQQTLGDSIVRPVGGQHLDADLWDPVDRTRLVARNAREKNHSVRL